MVMLSVTSKVLSSLGKAKICISLKEKLAIL